MHDDPTYAEDVASIEKTSCTISKQAATDAPALPSLVDREPAKHSNRHRVRILRRNRPVPPLAENRRDHALGQGLRRKERHAYSQRAGVRNVRCSLLFG